VMYAYDTMTFWLTRAPELRVVCVCVDVLGAQVLDYKRSVLAKTGSKPLCATHVTIPADIVTDDWEHCLLDHGTHHHHTSSSSSSIHALRTHAYTHARKPPPIMLVRADQNQAPPTAQASTPRSLRYGWRRGCSTT
jgi:hypothetical protein